MGKIKKLFITLLIVLTAFTLTSCGDFELTSIDIGFPAGFASSDKKANVANYPEGTTYIEAIDIGQGDAFLISGKEFGNVLIDTGDTKDDMDDYLVDFLNSKGIEKLDYVIISHPHMDHIGGMNKVLDNFEIDNIYMSKFKASTKTYKNMLKKIKAKGLLIDEAKDGVKINLSKGNSIEFISPDKYSKQDNIDDYAAICILNSYGKKTLFTADIPTKIEKKVYKKAGDIDILKVAHHGSRHSSKLPELKLIKPEYAVISVGANNKYGHPTKEALANLKKIGAEIYRTDKDWHIIFEINNKGEIAVTTAK